MENGDLKRVYEKLRQRNLADAIRAMEIYLSKRRSQANTDKLYAIEADLQRMVGYWRQGYRDPQAAEVYQGLLERMYALYANVSMSHAVGESPFLSSLCTRQHLSPRDWTVSSLRETLEGFVAEQAMIELEPPHKQLSRSQELNRRRHQFISEWFDRLWTSEIWPRSLGEAMTSLLLSPTIDSRDQQVIVSAITLSLLRMFDVEKWRALLAVYGQTSDEQVRQRALVGWALALAPDRPTELFPVVAEHLRMLTTDAAVCREVAELQQQLIYCINAEKDGQTIKEEIMPDLLKGGKIRVTRNGIEEIEDDTLSDILHPEEEDRRIEQMEESYRRMIEMEKQGADVYFGGFKQMKRFGFFKDIVNWFVPFYFEHPDIESIVGQFRDNKFFKTFLSDGYFCNSDKYSLILAFSQVLNHIPKNLREMFERGEMASRQFDDKVTKLPSHIRRVCLQDTYRFFRLYAYRSEFVSPFDGINYVFLANPCFTHTGTIYSFCDVAALMLKKGYQKEAKLLLSNTKNRLRDYRFCMMMAYLMLHDSDKSKNLMNDINAEMYYIMALQDRPDDEKAMAGYAKMLYRKRAYEEALDRFDQLLEIRPGKRSYLLSRAVCLTKLSRWEEAQQALYRLHYEDPDSADVNRVLAWALTCDSKFEQAIRLYSKLTDGEAETDDLLNYGYCLWLSGAVSDAANIFARYLKQSGEAKETVITTEKKLLKEHGITDVEMQLMLYQL